jgi:hypothetical protein
MLKNVSMIETKLNGKQSWRLLDPEGRPVRAFDIFAKTLERRSVNTRANYCRWLAEFFDYLFEAAVWTPVSVDGSVSQDTLLEVIEAYDEYWYSGLILVERSRAGSMRPYLRHVFRIAPLQSSMPLSGGF